MKNVKLVLVRKKAAMYEPDPIHGAPTDTIGDLADKVGRLKTLLLFALSEFELQEGRMSPDKFPNHWSVQARKELDLQ